MCRPIYLKLLAQWDASIYSLWIQLKPFSSSSHSNKCIVRTTMKQKKNDRTFSTLAFNTSACATSDNTHCKKLLPKSICFGLYSLCFIWITRSFLAWSLKPKDARSHSHMRYFISFQKVGRSFCACATCNKTDKTQSDLNLRAQM